MYVKIEIDKVFIYKIISVANIKKICYKIIIICLLKQQNYTYYSMNSIEI